MGPDFSRLADSLASANRDGYLLDDDSSLSNQLYLSGFDAPDPFVTLYTEGTVAILTTTLEYSRAVAESRADDVRRLSDYDYRETADEHGEAVARAQAVSAFLDEFGVESVVGNGRFPLFLADGLRERGIVVEFDTEDRIESLRAVKTSEELAHIRDAQRATEEATHVAEDLLAGSTVGDDDVLVYKGEPVTSERLKTTIERELVERGYALDDTIVASGPESALPHNEGSGPIRANEPVIVDVFPRSKSTQYHADMTRTFVKGTAGPTIREFYDLTQEAKTAALETIAAGVAGSVVHDAVCDVYEDAGYPTLRSAPSTDTGFVHGTGHGVGLDIHESPRISLDAGELEAGNVVTVEPGLYDPAVGGVRIEDLVVVTHDGFENLTDYPETLER